MKGPRPERGPGAPTRQSDHDPTHGQKDHDRNYEPVVQARTCHPDEKSRPADHAPAVPGWAPRPTWPPTPQPGARWRATRVRRYGRTDAVQITERTCLWYGSFRSRTVRVILVRDDKPRTRDRDDRGYGLPLVTTDLESSAEDLVARYASRWGIEQAFADARQIVGVGEARNRTRRAVDGRFPSG